MDDRWQKHHRVDWHRHGLQEKEEKIVKIARNRLKIAWNSEIAKIEISFIACISRLGREKLLKELKLPFQEYEDGQNYNFQMIEIAKIAYNNPKIDSNS